MNVAVIGGGAAGFFSAIQVATCYPNAKVVIYEKSSKLLSKVKVSGGGRCNVTHHRFEPDILVKNYPRGERFLRPLFWEFGPKELTNWFLAKGVVLKTEKDGRMFPVTDNSQTIIDCFLREAHAMGIVIIQNRPIINLVKGVKLELHFENGDIAPFDKVIVTTGGSAKLESYKWLQDLGHLIVKPVPSLFTFNMPDESVTSLMGVSVPDVIVKIVSEKLESRGPLLITHWGMSGPAILKLSAFAARHLYDKNYHFNISINWLVRNESEVRDILQQEREQAGKRQIGTKNPFYLPQRLWDFLLFKSGIANTKIWSQISKIEFNQLINTLCYDQYHVSGKTTFKEEFVTCGGISTSSVHSKTLESKSCPGLYFAGEVLDIDGITGGFNFQAAWTTAFVAAQLKTK